MMLTSDELKKLNDMIFIENELALLMCFVQMSFNNKNSSPFKMNGNSEPYFDKYCNNLQKTFAQAVLNDAMLQRVELQKKILKFVYMEFRDELVELQVGEA
ncbi:hypothetical protein G3485_07800 [Shewanella baltica]|uniref:hypothetical protein n=1 Tax=Shewanella baltica TaxID=62322 RepID=UPI00217E5F5D|nr:hypothetical protein [Shewanella baltica]MCS6126633.1 hypothetical protein [Shewanella baltica]MCS6138706.1 hypothetical protein [Shewanella baltica]MCS6144895.1 hypothetical protein [Shewanella baltica]MCS6169425.1 hypothetical protein [Shewanella baltica]MCS6186649.1 hypothetical protein [Shewanella baltica]